VEVPGLASVKGSFIINTSPTAKPGIVNVSDVEAENYVLDKLQLGFVAVSVEVTLLLAPLIFIL
jgi:hypothetical protein